MRPRGVHTAARRVGAKAAANCDGPSQRRMQSMLVVWGPAGAVSSWSGCDGVVALRVRGQSVAQATPDAARAKGAKGLSLAARLTLAPSPSWRETRYTLQLQVESARP